MDLPVELSFCWILEGLKEPYFSIAKSLFLFISALVRHLEEGLVIIDESQYDKKESFWLDFLLER